MRDHAGRGQIRGDSVGRNEPRSCCCDREHLTDREVDVLCLVADGHSNAEVAKLLGLSVHTVVRYMTTMLRKAGQRSRAGLVSKAHRDGVLILGDHGAGPTGRRCLEVES